MKSGLLLFTSIMISSASVFGDSGQFDRLYASFDRTVATSGQVINRQTAVIINPDAPAGAVELPLLPRDQISALDVSGSDIYFTPTLTSTVSGRLLSPSNVYRLTQSGEILEAFPASNLQIQPPISITAIAVDETRLLFAISQSAYLGQIEATPRDVLEWNSADLTIRFTSAQLQIPEHGALTGLGVTNDGKLLFSSSAPPTGEAQPGKHASIFKYDETSATITRVADYLLTSGACPNCVLRAFSAEFDDQILFRSSFGSQWEAQ